MPEEYLVVEKNVTGRYYVDKSCIYCELCLQEAPANFSHDEVKGEAYVSTQPQTAEEHTLMAEAIDGCPTSSIHDSFSSRAKDLGLAKDVTPTSLVGSMMQIIIGWSRKN
jgi:ferredoxin